MGRPHPALVDIAAGRPTGVVDTSGDLVRSAVEHRMAGLLWSRIQHEDPARPGPWLKVLARHDLATRAHQQRLWMVLQTVAERMLREGFEVATVKGLTAQARWYDREGERPCTDVDLLVHPGRVDDIEEIVASIKPDHKLLGHVRSLVRDGYLQWIDIEVAPGLWVDLHVDLFKLGIPTRQREIIWDRARSFALPNGQVVLVPDPEISLVHFLLHLTRDGFSYLLGLADVGHILQREDLDWGFIDRFVRSEGLDTQFHLALDTVVGTLGLSPPLLRYAVSGWRASVWKALWPPASTVQGHAGAAARRRRHLFFLSFLTRGRGVAALRWWLGRSFPPRVMAEHWYQEGPSPYLLRLAWGRLSKARGRRRASSARGPLGAGGAW